MAGRRWLWLLATLAPAICFCVWRLAEWNRANGWLDSEDTPNVFPCREDSDVHLFNVTALGIAEMKRSKVVFAAVVQDAVASLSHNLVHLERLQTMFAEARFVFFESGSADGTREFLLDWHRRNPATVVIGCGLNAPICRLPWEADLPANDLHAHTAKMARRRNILLEHLRQHYSGYNYAVMWDPQRFGRFYIDGLASTFGYLSTDRSLDAQCAYGLSPDWLTHWRPSDTFTHLQAGERLEDVARSGRLFSLWWGLRRTGRCSEPFSVASCFGGLAVYKERVINTPHRSYSFSPSRTTISEHFFFNLGLRMQVNPSMIYASWVSTVRE